MKTPRVIFFAVLLAAVGCATTTVRPDLSRIHIGMPQVEAQKLLGPPSEVATARAFSDRVEIYRYVTMHSGKTNDCIVVFYEGKVKEFGPYVGYLKREAYPNVFPDAKF